MGTEEWWVERCVNVEERCPEMYRENNVLQEITTFPELFTIMTNSALNHGSRTVRVKPVLEST